MDARAEQGMDARVEQGMDARTEQGADNPQQQQAGQPPAGDALVISVWEPSPRKLMCIGSSGAWAPSPTAHPPASSMIIRPSIHLSPIARYMCRCKRYVHVHVRGRAHICQCMRCSANAHPLRTPGRRGPHGRPAEQLCHLHGMRRSVSV